MHRTKPELSLEIVKEARRRGLQFEWVGGDEVYGNNRELTDALEALGETFLMDVASNLHIYESDPRLQTEPSPSSKAARSKTIKAGDWKPRSRTVEVVVREHFARESRTITVRETTKGTMRVRIWVKEVWQWDGKTSEPRPRLLVVRREKDGTFKYSLSNASAKTSWERLGFMQAQRFWIERAFQDAKSELGMAQYEVRGWRAWHHHMALVCLAMFFVVRERVFAADHTPLLSARDVVELLTHYLPRRNRTEEEVLASMRARHKARERDLKRYQKT
jgi:SRSO17 transposase